MRRSCVRSPENLVAIYIYLAVGCGIAGVLLTYLVIFLTQYLGVDIRQHLWVLAIPPVGAVLLNVCVIELYRKYRRH